MYSFRNKSRMLLSKKNNYRKIFTNVWYAQGKMSHLYRICKNMSHVYSVRTKMSQLYSVRIKMSHFAVFTKICHTCIVCAENDVTLV